MKKILVFFLCGLLCLGVAACGSSENPESDTDPLEGVSITGAYDGYWSDGAGSVLFLDSSGRHYFLQVSSGRCGRGSYLPGESAPTLIFDGDTYTIVASDGSFTLHCAGISGTESLDGMTFFRDDWAELNMVSALSTDGSWVNPSGGKILIFTDRHQYEASTGTVGKLADAGDGKGPYLESDGEKLYLVLSADQSSLTVLGGEASGLSGTFLRELSVPGVNDAETLALYANYYDTWYQYASKNRASVTLRADGTWESYDSDRIKNGDGTFYVTEAESIVLYDTARKFVGSAMIDASDRLHYTAEDPEHEDTVSYSRAAVSR